MQGGGVAFVSVAGEFTGELPVDMNWCFFNTWNGAWFSKGKAEALGPLSCSWPLGVGSDWYALDPLPG